MIFRYLKGTLDYGLWYPRTNHFTLIAYIDVDWPGCIDDRKSTSGGTFFLGGRLVSWHSKKQESISLSTIEAKYIVATFFHKQVLWMIQTIQDIKVNVPTLVSILCDNTSAMNISKNPIMHSITKHISIK